MALSLAAMAGCSNADDEGPGTEPGPLTEQESTSPEESAQTAGFPTELLPPELSPDLPLVAPENEREIPVFSDIVTVAAGEDVTFCTFTDVILEEATIFGQSFGAQSPQGHHAILQYTTTPQEPHTGSCAGMDGQMLLGGTGGKSVANELYLPENFGVEVPAGAQLIINHHWINTTTEEIEGQSMMVARGLERGGDTVMAGNMILFGYGWEIPAQAPYTFTTACTYSEDVPYVLAIGHMHEYGTNVSVEIDRVGGTTETLIDQEWSAEAATGNDPDHVFSLEDPFMIRAGDTVRLTCEWNNDTSEVLGYPREMCIFFGYTVGANYLCANDAWLTMEQATAAGMGSQQVIDHL